MPRRLRCSLCALFAISLLSPIVGVAAPEKLPKEKNDRFIVLLKKGANTEVASDTAKRHGINAKRIFSHAGGFSADLTSNQIQKLEKDDAVRLIEPDAEVHSFITFPPCFPFKCSSSSSSTSSSASSQTLPTGINRANAEQSPTANINGSDQRVNIDVAVIDTGVQADHPDLNVYRSVNFSANNNTRDENGHGTHVAGTIGALDNGIGVVGMAPGARIWSVKVLDRRGSGYISDIVEGIDYVADHSSEIEVANMSLGCECQSTALNEALTRATDRGVVFAVAAGNSAKNATTFSPANHPDVITVSAVADFNGLSGGGAAATCYNDVDDTFANFSNFGQPVDIAAPGVCIRSTWKGSTYNTISGTSMASPHVAGAAALYIATHSKPLTKADTVAVKNALQSVGFVQGSSDGFSGDPDSQHEPLLNAAGF